MVRYDAWGKPEQANKWKGLVAEQLTEGLDVAPPGLVGRHGRESTSRDRKGAAFGVWQSGISRVAGSGNRQTRACLPCMGDPNLLL
jgi:hypothetical protein